IVSQPLTNEPLDPLVEGEQLLLYRGEDECVSHCVRLLEDRDEAARLQSAARAYYERAVEPMAVARRLLRRAITQ
ncbi:MAG TPA: glycosyltransferase, partial [Myxococcales bacterium]